MTNNRQRSIKICHMTSVHNRYDVRVYEKECRSLVHNGYDVTLIVNDCYDDEIIDNVKIISTKCKYKNRADRILNAKKIIFRKAINVNADIYHFHDPELLPVGNKLKRIGKKVIFDSHEDVPEQIKDKQWLPRALRNIISELYSIYEKQSAKRYDSVISVTPHIVERFKKVNTNTIMITNYPIVGKTKEKKENAVNTICFAGGISAQWNHDKIIKAIENIDEIEYLLAGSGTDEYIKLLKSLPGWNKVNYVGKIPHADVKDLYSKSVSGMALNYSSQAKGKGTLGNTKLFEYMMAGIPVICTNFTLWQDIINNYNCGVCINPENVDEISAAIKYLHDHPEEACQMGKNGRRAVEEKFNWGKEEKKLLELYEELAREVIRK